MSNASCFRGLLGRLARVFKCGTVVFFFLCPVAGIAANLSSLTVTPTTVTGGSPLEITIAFDAPVPDIFVPLTSDHTLIVDVPSFWVGAGATDTTKNQGGGSAAASTTTLYLSTNAIYEAGDTSLGSRAIPILATLATSAGSTSVTIPAGTIPGAYYILGRADANAAIAETTETNNVTSKVINITP